ncbi:MAG TPA: sarcosine oxidase subunit alpha family protein [Casimicrobiaceae bacterium]|nr:sarcosine oxidase subunit alpha family protein [Casimicrobiaceae bacterium]
MTQRWRLERGGEIDRSRPLAFEFDGARYEGFAGDTLASALLANGVHLVARSFKYHRPRGIYTAGCEEPSALVQLALGARTEPNTRATIVELYEGLQAASQNCWPSLRFDLGAVANALWPMLPAGFYYKTFMWPGTPRWWLKYEHFIRRAAGMGIAPRVPDPARYDHQYAHCDVLVIGGGPAGLAAAHAAARRGARVIVCQQSARFAVRRAGSDLAGDARAAQRIDDKLAELRANPNVTLLARTAAFGYYDGNLVAAVERLTDHVAAAPAHLPRQRLWMIRAKAVVLATGAIERGIAYASNDLPGTFLAGAVLAYTDRYAVRLGNRAVVFTTHDLGYPAALALHRAGMAIEAIVDVRPEARLEGEWPRRARAAGLRLLPDSAVVKAHGGRRVAGVEVRSRGSEKTQSLPCDVVAVSGGYSPAVHLYSQARGRLRYDETLAAFVPDASPMPIFTAGALQGSFDCAAAIAEGEAAGAAAADRAARPMGWTRGPAPSEGPPSAGTQDAASKTPAPLAVQATWATHADRRGAKSFVDLQEDVSVRDISIANREGYRSVEHLKRYTTLGMGTDQGKTSNVIGLALMSEALGVAIPAVGTTTFRPPYTPVTLGALPGDAHGAHVEPTRYSAMHGWHAERGVRFVNAGLWKRPHSYPRPGESEDNAANREARNVRENVGIVDVSTLGKIELQGRDAGEFLNRVYANRFDTLAVGRCRYGIMLREDGIVRDDGTTSRLDERHYLMTTTTANAASIMQHLERLLQVDWPELDVYATSVTEQWAAAALSGPKSRSVLERCVDTDVSNAALPFLGLARCHVRTAQGEVQARVLRISYSGELAYEIHVPADRGRALWEALIAAGESFGILPYGTEAMTTLRVEKGHVVIGAEIDGRTTAADLGMEKLVAPGKWCIGQPLLTRPALVAPDRWQLVGLKPVERVPIPRGGKIVADPHRRPPNPMLGHVTSWCFSPHLDAWIALGLVSAGRSRHGERLWAVSPLSGEKVQVEIVAPVFIDPEGARVRS